MSLIATEVGVFLSSTSYSEAWERWFNAREKYRESKDVGLQLLVAQLVPDYLATVHPELPHDDLSSFKSYCATATAEEVSTLHSVLSEAESFWLNQKASSAIREYCRELLQLTDQIFQERAQKTPKAQIFRFVAGGFRFYDRLKSVPASDEERREALKSIMRANTSLVQAGTNNGFTQELLWLIVHLDKVLDLSQIQRQPAVFFYNKYLQFAAPDFSRLLKIEATIERKAMKVSLTQKSDSLEIDLGPIDFKGSMVKELQLRISLTSSSESQGFLSLQQETFTVQLLPERKLSKLRIPYSYTAPDQAIDVVITFRPARVTWREREIDLKLETFKQLENLLTLDIPLDIEGYDLTRLLKTAKVTSEALRIEDYRAKDSQTISVICRMTNEALASFRAQEWEQLDNGIYNRISTQIKFDFSDIDGQIKIDLKVTLHKLFQINLDNQTGTFQFRNLQGTKGLLQVFANDDLLTEKNTEQFTMKLPSALQHPELYDEDVTLRIIFAGEEVYRKTAPFLPQRVQMIENFKSITNFLRACSFFLSILGVVIMIGRGDSDNIALSSFVSKSFVSIFVSGWDTDGRIQDVMRTVDERYILSGIALIGLGLLGFYLASLIDPSGKDRTYLWFLEERRKSIILGHIIIFFVLAMHVSWVAACLGNRSNDHPNYLWWVFLVIMDISIVKATSSEED